MQRHSPTRLFYLSCPRLLLCDQFIFTHYSVTSVPSFNSCHFHLFHILEPRILSDASTPRSYKNGSFSTILRSYLAPDSMSWWLLLPGPGHALSSDIISDSYWLSFPPPSLSPIYFITGHWSPIVFDHFFFSWMVSTLPSFMFTYIILLGLLQDYTIKFDSFLLSFAFVAHTVFYTPKMSLNFLSKVRIAKLTFTRRVLLACPYAIFQAPLSFDFSCSVDLPSMHRTLLTLFFHWPLLCYNNLSRWNPVEAQSYFVSSSQPSSKLSVRALWTQPCGGNQPAHCVLAPRLRLLLFFGCALPSKVVLRVLGSPLSYLVTRLEPSWQRCRVSKFRFSMTIR